MSVPVIGPSEPSPRSYQMEKLVAQRVLGRYADWFPEVAMRYLSVLRLLRELGFAPDGFLEVGSGPLGISPYTRGLVIGADVSFEPEAGPGLIPIACSTLTLPFPARAAQSVISVDMLEHVPAQLRPIAVRELVRVSGQVLAIAVPSGSDSSGQDARLDRYYQARHGTSYPFFSEHLEHGLPTRDDLASCIAAALDEEGRPATVVFRAAGNIRLREQLMRAWIRSKSSRWQAGAMTAVNLFASLLSRVNIGPCYRIIAVVDFRPVILTPPGD